MDNNTLTILKIYSNEIRKTMKSMIYELNGGDFTGWCELASMLMYRAVHENLPQIKENIIMEGKFRNSGHYWNVIDGVIVDLTIDQFGKYKTGIVNSRWLNNYKIKRVKPTDVQDLKHMTDEFIDFIGIYYLSY